MDETYPPCFQRFAANSPPAVAGEPPDRAARIAHGARDWRNGTQTGRGIAHGSVWERGMHEGSAL